MSGIIKFDPKLDLSFERVVDVPPEIVWKAWTTPEHLVKWFAPRPWTTVDAEIDLRPGGIFRTTMRSPEGQEFPNIGSYVEVVPNKRLVWTDALLPGFRPKDGSFFSAMIILEPYGKGCKYTAAAIHKDEAGKKQHEAMGFREGWGTCLDQLVEYAKQNMK